eukprot:7034478-Pyramimonas_sp.AAC.2
MLIDSRTSNRRRDRKGRDSQPRSQQYRSTDRRSAPTPRERSGCPRGGAMRCTVSGRPRSRPIGRRPTK